MPQIYVEYERLNQFVGSVDSISKKLSEIRDKFQSTVKQLDWEVRCQSDINNTANKISRQLSTYNTTLKSYHNFMTDTAVKYSKLDSAKLSNSLFNNSNESNLAKDFLNEYGFGGLLGGAGLSGVAYGILENFKKGNIFKIVDDSVKGFKDVKKSILRYKKLGTRIGAEKAKAKWIQKELFGVKSVGYTSKASNVVARFTDNLTNANSPFKKQITDAVGNFTGKNGAISAVASWATVGVTGLINFKNNKEEQALSGGKMSDGRVVAETITETAIDTAVGIGAVAVASAAVAAVAPVATTGILIAACAGAVVAGVNVGFKAVHKAITGEEKSLTEWASDLILDGIENKVENLKQKIGTNIKSAQNVLIKWFPKLFST